MKIENFPFEDENIDYKEEPIIYNPIRQLHVHGFHTINKRFKNYIILWYLITIIFWISFILSMIFHWNTLIFDIFFIISLITGYLLIKFKTKLGKWLNKKTLI